MNYMNINENPIIVLKAHDRKKVRFAYANIMPSVIMKTEGFTEDTPRWQVQDAINVARIHGIFATSRSLKYFTHETVMILHGIPIWGSSPSVYSASKRRLNTRYLRDVKVLKQSYSSSAYYPNSIELNDPNIVQIDGLPVESLEYTAVRMALSRDTITAVSAVSLILHKLVSFSRSEQEQSRKREKEMKQSLLDLLDRIHLEHPGIQKYHRARTIISRANAGCETIPEAVLLPIVDAVFTDLFETQFRIHAKGRDYYADFAVPYLQLLIEFDGMGKMGATEQAFLDAREKQTRRQYELEALGYKFIRFRWRDLQDLRELYYRLVSFALQHDSNYHLCRNELRSYLNEEYFY